MPVRYVAVALLLLLLLLLLPVVVVTAASGVDYEGIMRSMRTTGYQATNLGLAIEEVPSLAPVRSAASLLTSRARR